MYQTGEELDSLEGLQLTEGLELPEGLKLPEGLSASAELENLVVEEEELQGELHEVTKCAVHRVQLAGVHIFNRPGVAGARLIHHT